MAELRFGTGDNDRRRRHLAMDLNSEIEFDSEPGDSGSTATNSSSGAAFHLLSRDQMLRRLISPRLWKHAVILSLLLLPPVILVTIINWSTPSLGLSTAVQTENVRAILRGVAGLELFVAGQLCLLICWVRAASAIDFKGAYRTWRWLAALLVGASFLMLTGAAGLLTDLIAFSLQHALGSIDSARPALLVVPVGAFSAFVLRHLIPDMGRCRPAQSLAVAAIAMAILRLILGMRGTMNEDPGTIVTLEFLICGLTLSAVQLHCRFVLHVNPNPPAAVGTTGSSAVCRSEARESVLSVIPPSADETSTEHVDFTVVGDAVVSDATAEDTVSVSISSQTQADTGELQKQTNSEATPKQKSGRKKSRKAG